MTEKTGSELAVLNTLFGKGEASTALAATMSSATTELAESKKLSKGSSFIRRIQLFNGNKQVKADLIKDGHFGIPVSANEVIDLGKSVDLLVLWRRPKAMDFTGGTKNIITSYDTNSDEFKRIVEAADKKSKGFAYGPTYLTWLREVPGFFEFYAGNASGRIASSLINQYMIVTQDMIDNELTDEEEPRPPKPMTLKSELVEDNDGNTYFVPKVEDCLTPFDKMFTVEAFNESLQKFLASKSTGVKTVAKDAARSRDR